jgi:hypothetical protein
MKRLILLILVLSPLAAFAQTDPLNVAYKPVVNTTCPNTTANGTGSNIWITDTMQKILQGNATAGTNCFQQIFATQGEFGDFQVHVVAPGGGYSALTVSSSSFVCSTGPTCGTPFTIPAPSTSSANIVVYREAYHTLTKKTNVAAAYYNVLGAFPDALIPAIDPYFHQNTSAFPVAVTAAQTQSAWVDVFVPQNAPSGYYRGTITVSNSGTTLATIPVILAVWQWPAAQGGFMPATSSVRTELQSGGQDFCAYEAYGAGGTGTNCGAYPPAAGNLGLGQQYGQIAGGVMMLDHRISAFSGFADFNNQNWQAHIEPWIRGTNNGTLGAFTFNTIIPSAKITELRYSTTYGSLQTIATAMATESSFPVLPIVEACDEPSASGVTST